MRHRENIRRQYYSPWCDRVLLQLERKGMTNEECALAIGMSDFAVHSLLTGRTKPPIEKLRLLANAIGIPPGEIESFVRDGQLQHAPRDVRTYVAELERQVAALTTEVAKHRLSGSRSE